MYLEKTETPMDLTFQLFYEQIQQAHQIYEMHCFIQDFIKCCMERQEEAVGLCNLPYQSLPDESELLDRAYQIYCKKEDANVAYNDTMNSVVDKVEQEIATGEIYPATNQEAPRVAIVIEDGIISAAYSSDPKIQIEIAELDKNYAASEQRDAVYKQLQEDPALRSCEYGLTIPGYEESLGLEVDE